MTKAEQWRALSRQAAQEEAIDLTLPSGMTIRARRPGPAFVAQYARLPMSLATKVAEADGAPVTTAPATVDGTLVDFFRDLLVFCVVEPRISLIPGPDEIHPRDITNEDCDYIVAWAMRREEAESLEAFRQFGRNGSAGNGRAHVSPAPVGATGHSGSDAGPELRPGGDAGSGAA